MEGMTNKAKRVFTPEQKFEILKDIERQESVKVGLEKYHLSSTTLRERLFSPINKKTGHKGVEWGMLNKIPFKVKTLKLPDVKDRWWDKKEYIVSFLEESKKSRHYGAFKLALECGLRVGEITGLSKQDVDLKRCQLHIHRQWLDSQKCLGPTKGRRERFINFDPNSGLKEALAKAILASPHSEAIFVTENGNRLRSRKLAGRHFNLILKRSGVPKIRFHDLRHTFASWFMTETDDIWSLKSILGHSDIQTTQRYAHLSERNQKAPKFSWNGVEKNFSRLIHAPN